MKTLNGYAQAQTYTESERLPVGGYVLKILDVKEVVSEWGNTIVISFDIEEIQKAGFRTTTPMVVCNSDEYSKINVVTNGLVSAGEKLIDLQ